MLQVMFSSINILRKPVAATLKRNSHIGSSVHEYCLEMLKDRGLLRVHGVEGSSFLQGLITNDMKHLEEGAQSMYSMFLNVRGRVMCDSLIYKESDKTFLIEIDKNALVTLQKHLKMYRVRKKIDIDIDNNYNVWVIFPKIRNEYNKCGSNPPREIIHENALHFQDSNLMKMIQKKSKILCRDPRLIELGYRAIIPIEEQMNLDKDDDSETYKTLRYKLGVGEGVEEIPIGKSFPLELNSDFLHGVSFHKGCYIGQELTARVYHTGVIRKRLMPLILDDLPSEKFVIDATIENAMNCKAVGKLRGLEKTYGLGLMRINEALSSPSLSVLNITGNVFKPLWWPQEAPKERSIVGKEIV